MDSLFLKELIDNLASITKVEHALIAGVNHENDSDFIETMALWSHGKFLENTQFALYGTPCKEVLDGNISFYSEGVQKLFPDDEELISMNAEGYLGCPLLSSSGQCFGYICILSTRPLENEQHLTTIIKAFASLASSELERERDLHSSEEKFSKALELSPDAVVITRVADGKILDANDACIKMTGYLSEELLGKTTIELNIYSAEERERVVTLLTEHGKYSNFESTLRTKNGVVLNTLASGVVLEIKGERCIFAIIHDVTERKGFERELKRSQKLLEESNWLLEVEKKALEQISSNTPPNIVLKELITAVEKRYPEIILSVSRLVDNDQYLISYATSRLPDEYVKEKGKVKIGPKVGSCGTAAFLNKNVFVSDISSDPLWKNYKKLAGKYGLCACWSMPITSSTGAMYGTMAVYYKKVKVADKEHIEVLDQLRKIAEISFEQEKSRNELEQSEEKFRSAFGKAPIVVTLLDRNGNVLQSNKKAFALLGYTEKEIVGMSIADFTHPDDHERSMKMYKLLVTGEIDHYEIEKRYIGKSGQIVWAQLNISSVMDAQKNFSYAIAHNLDITERKKFEVVHYEKTEEEAVFANLLKFSFLPIDEYMKLSLEEILSVSWIKVEDKGGIFLTKEQGDSNILQLVTSKKMPDELLKLCDNVDFGACLCGRAAESKQVQFADCVDERHETRYQGMEAHGHYNIPIINDGKVLGVIVLYLAEGHQSQKKEIGFLKRVADVLSLGIARKYAEAKVNYQAAHDSLTGLISRREFETRLQQVLNLADSNSEHALCYLDLDQFKVINDDCGHLGGDELLHQLAVLLQSKVRKRDTLARLGGDEFGLLMEHCPISEAMRVAESLRTSVEEFRFVWEQQNFSLGVSIGLVPIISGKSNVKGVLGAADAACYAAKDAGRNRIHIYNPEDVGLAQRRGEMKWVTKIKDAIVEDRLRLYVQPIVPLFAKDEDRDKKHFECLIRMMDEDGKIVPPGAFLPAAERYDLSTRIDQWVFDATCAWLEKRPGKSKGMTSCSVNLSGHSLSNDEFLRHIVDKLDQGKILPSTICFEITETVAISKLSNAIKFMEVLKDKGCSFALDDFGSGVSSFGYLKNLPVDFLKIDGMFVRDMVDDPIDLEMVRSINQIGHVMGKRTIAEFVENKEILACLKDLGVDYAQGYHLGKPRAVKVPVLKASEPEISKKKVKKKSRQHKTRKTD